MNRLEELMALVMDGLATDAELRELDALLDADETGGRRLVHLFRIESALRSSRVRFPLTTSVPAVLRADQGRRLADSVLDQVRRLPRPRSTRTTLFSPEWFVGLAFWKSGPKWLPAWSAALALAAVVLVSGWGVWNSFKPVDGSGPWTVVQARGLEVRRGWRWQTVEPGATLEGEPRLRTGLQGNATLRGKREATTVALGGQTRMRLEHGSSGKRWSLDQGRIEVHAAHQPDGRPLRISTTHGEAEVVGTTFSLSARKTATWLQVEEGSVRLHPSPEQQGLLVPAGQFSVATMGRALELQANRPGEILRLPVALDFQQAFHDGDGEWRLEGTTLHQVRVSHVPMSHPVWGTSDSPGSAYILKTTAWDSIELSCDVEVERTIHDEVPGWIWPQTFGLRFYFGATTFQFNAEGGGAGQAASLSLGGPGSPDSGGTLRLTGRTQAPLASAGRGLHHFRLQLWRQPAGDCHVLGRVWTGPSEPEHWAIDAQFHLDQPLTQVGMQTVSCSARFHHFQVSLID